MGVVVIGLALEEMPKPVAGVGVVAGVELGAGQRFPDAARPGLGVGGVAKNLCRGARVPAVEQAHAAPIPVVDVAAGTAAAWSVLLVMVIFYRHDRLPTPPALVGPGCTGRDHIHRLPRTMPVMTAFRTSPRAAAGGGLILAPVRGVRFDPQRVSDLAAVTSPPYDVIEPDGVRRLETLDPHNIVRVILPRDEEGGPLGRYQQAADTLRTWLADGVLAVDDAPALYVYEQATPTLLQRGLIGALGLRDPAERVILPHEDVMPGPVADRLELMRAIEANPDPILLMYDGGGAASDVVESMCGTPPLTSLRTSDGIGHRLWAVRASEVIEKVAADLAPRQAMIADGHHRYASYRRLQAETHAAGRGPGPWDHGLALLVDSRRHPLELKAIHRVLPKLRPDDAVGRLQQWCAVGPLGAATADTAVLLDPALAGAPAYALVGSGARWLVTDPDAALLERSLPADRPEAWRCLDAAVLHHALLDRVLDVADDPEHVTYHHDAEDAVRAAAHTGGVALLMRPADPDVVVSLAAAGVRMPRKSTSFGPKPPTGLILRTFAAG